MADVDKKDKDSKENNKRKRGTGASKKEDKREAAPLSLIHI